MNTRIEYLYRDASNYKRWTEAVFANPDEIPVEDIWSEIEVATQPWRLFGDMVHFKPELVGLATCYLTSVGYAASEDDLELHELHRVDETKDQCTDLRTIVGFLRDLRRVGGDRLGSTRSSGSSATWD